jgi:hypothetical protein
MTREGMSNRDFTEGTRPPLGDPIDAGPPPKEETLEEYVERLEMERIHLARMTAHGFAGGRPSNSARREGRQ